LFFVYRVDSLETGSAIVMPRKKRLNSFGKKGYYASVPGGDPGRFVFILLQDETNVHIGKKHKAGARPPEAAA
jgi:hypothetical protein